MATKIYVGNLAFATTDTRLASVFAQIGKVEKAEIIQDYYTGRSRGFGFVLMASENEAGEAIRQLNGTDLDGRPIKVSEARQRNGAANGYASSDYGAGGYGKIYGSDGGRRQRW